MNINLQVPLWRTVVLRDTSMSFINTTYQLNNHVRIYHFHSKNVKDIHIILQIKGKISVDKTYNPKVNYFDISNGNNCTFLISSMMWWWLFFFFFFFINEQQSQFIGWNKFCNNLVKDCVWYGQIAAPPPPISTNF